ncbi:MAG TPA: class A beta-lactamase-related serine hydrolase, partial [Epsilonproteobacteria bacterium]|nr:class A beta-lactamase-related serine hydrolase [Campylobacterota bacterium]
KSQPPTGVAGDGTIGDVVSFYKEKYALPAIAVITVKDDQTVEKSGKGLRRMEDSVPVSEQEYWGIGSITKSMTATLTAAIIDSGILNWDTTLAEIFPEFDGMQERYRSITVSELLSHSAGLPQDDDEVWAPFVQSDTPLSEQRYALTEEVLKHASDQQRGKFLYSNINYVVVAAILEKLTSKSFEELIRTRLFEPLGMHHSRVAVSGQRNSVWGHKYHNGQWVSVDPGIDDVDNAAIVAPAGSRTFMTLDDMGIYLSAHLRAMHGNTTLMALQNFRKLHTKVVDADEDLGYAMGWFTEGTYGLQHSGSDNRWLALSFINSDTGFAYFVVINAYKVGIEQVVFEMLQALIKRTDVLSGE